MNTLMQLNDEEFADEIRESLFDNDLWAAFMEVEVADRTKAVLLMLSASIRGQLTKFADSDNADRGWVIRARNMLRSVNARTAETNTAIRRRNREQTASVESMERKWANLAFALADALAASDMDFLLDEILVDGGDPITARRWMEKRREQKLAKGVDPFTGRRVE